MAAEKKNKKISEPYCWQVWHFKLTCLMKVLFSVDPYISSGKYGYNQVLISSVWIPCDVDSDLQKSETGRCRD